MKHPASLGFTLIECLMVLAIASILAGIGVPSLRSQLLRGARLDAVHALSAVQREEENFRSAHGLYSADLTTLRGVAASSPQGRYSLTLALTGPDSYRATAQAVGEQERDTSCARITLDVTLGFATRGPTSACWGR